MPGPADFVSRGDADAFEAALGGASTTPELAALVGTARRLGSIALPAPDPAFVADLGAQLHAQATSAPAGSGAEGPQTPGEDTTRVVTLRRTWPKALVGAAAGVVVATTGLGVASRDALPGDALYGVRRLVEGAEVDLAGSDGAKGRTLLDQARHHVEDTGTLADREHPDVDDLRESLKDAAAAVSTGSGDLFRAYDTDSSPDHLADVQDFTTWVQPRIAGLRAKLPAGAMGELGTLQSTVDASAATLRTKLAACGDACRSITPPAQPSTPGSTRAQTPPASRPPATAPASPAPPTSPASPAPGRPTAPATEPQVPPREGTGRATSTTSAGRRPTEPSGTSRTTSEGGARPTRPSSPTAPRTTVTEPAPTSRPQPTSPTRTLPTPTWTITLGPWPPTALPPSSWPTIPTTPTAPRTSSTPAPRPTGTPTTASDGGPTEVPVPGTTDVTSTSPAPSSSSTSAPAPSSTATTTVAPSPTSSSTATTTEAPTPTATTTVEPTPTATSTRPTTPAPTTTSASPTATPTPTPTSTSPTRPGRPRPPRRPHPPRWPWPWPFPWRHYL